MDLSKLTYTSTIPKRTKATYMIPAIIILTTIRKTIDTRVGLILIGKTTFLDFIQSSKRLVRWSLCNEIQKERTHASSLDSRNVRTHAHTISGRNNNIVK